ncbi:MAG: NAD-dependent epimerase/dehydratase family protein [Spirochaetia bacterium]|nr:NAD-dependent epimerase/dehydratase family protein [Spirochaetia bacterium]
MDKKQSPVLVTGGSGYIASWIIIKLLEKGYSVHTTVRDPENSDKTAFLRKLSDTYSGKLSLFKADLMVPESYREAMTGCVSVIHTASPFVHKISRSPVQELINPAVKGTANVLETACQIKTIKRIVLTSSVAAILTDNCEVVNNNIESINEDYWNETASITYQPYSYSKTLAEKRAWEIAVSQDNWDLVVMNPAFVLGPSLLKRTDGVSANFIQRVLSGQLKFGTPDLHFGIVDVRDVADAHIRGLEKPYSAGRHILSSESASFVKLARILKNSYGKRVKIRTFKLPKILFYLIGPALGFSWKYIKNNYGVPLALNSEKARNELGIVFRPLDITVNDHAEQLIQDGLVTKLIIQNN